MIAISKEEKDFISKEFPKVHIVRTMKQKSKRHHYYCEESRAVMRYLDQIRNHGVVKTEKEGVSHTSRKKSK